MVFVFNTSVVYFEGLARYDVTDHALGRGLTLEVHKKPETRTGPA